MVCVLKRTVVACLIALALSLLLPASPAAHAQDDPSQLVSELAHKDPKVRAAAATLIGERNLKPAMKEVVKLLREEKDLSVRAELERAMVKLADGPLPAKFASWTEWWDADGKGWFENAKFPQPENAVRKTLEDYKNWMTFILVITAFLAVIVVLLMLVFTAMGSNRLKAAKEIIKQAEKYIADSEEISRRNDKILSEMEQKRSLLGEFAEEIKDDIQSEIDHFSDVQQKSVEHKLREITMSLRESAEKELGQTLREMKEATDRDIKRTVIEMKDKTSVSLNEQFDKIRKEMESYVQYLEASFLLSNDRAEEAAKRFRALVEKRREHFVAWNGLSSAYRKLGRFQEALDASFKGLEIAPEDPALLFGQAASSAALKRKPQALESLKKAVFFNIELKDEAMNDPSFKEYWKDPEFRNLVE